MEWRTMRRISLAVMATTALTIAALGAGMQSASAAPATYNWSGFYMGLNAGGNWGTSSPSTSLTGGSFFGACPSAICSDFAAKNNQSINTSGFTGGIQGGYNWQSGNLLAGIELDFDYFRNNSTLFYAAGLQPNGGVTTNIKTDWLFTARPRLGMVANNWLFYGTGGLAVTRIKASWSYSDTLNAPCDCESASVSKTKAGWTVGGGIEAALPGGWIVGGEYLYVKFGSVSASGVLTIPPFANFWTDVFNHTIDLNSNIVRARFSKKF
jgi:outer membrane immunogenic protein